MGKSKRIASYRRNNRRIITMFMSSQPSITASRTMTSVSGRTAMMSPSLSTSTPRVMTLKMPTFWRRTIFLVQTSMLWVVSYQTVLTGTERTFSSRIPWHFYSVNVTFTIPPKRWRRKSDSLKTGQTGLRVMSQWCHLTWSRDGLSIQNGGHQRCFFETSRKSDRFVLSFWSNDSNSKVHLIPQLLIWEKFSFLTFMDSINSSCRPSPPPPFFWWYPEQKSYVCSLKMHFFLWYFFNKAT